MRRPRHHRWRPSDQLPVSSLRHPACDEPSRCEQLCDGVARVSMTSVRSTTSDGYQCAPARQSMPAAFGGRCLHQRCGLHCTPTDQTASPPRSTRRSGRSESTRLSRSPRRGQDARHHSGARAPKPVAREHAMNRGSRNRSETHSTPAIDDTTSTSEAPTALGPGQRTRDRCGCNNCGHGPRARPSGDPECPRLRLRRSFACASGLHVRATRVGSCSCSQRKRDI